jgi:ribosomal protein S1
MNPKKGKILEGQITHVEDEAAFVDVGLPRLEFNLVTKLSFGQLTPCHQECS